MKKLFGGIDLTWPKLICFAVIAGLYTGLMAYLPMAKGTSFADISITFEWWILFGILIIMNSKSPIDSALKCFIFFLISQPIVYLVQVPFNVLGWGIFSYYRNWFIATLFTLPMGFVGYYMKDNKWYSLLILLPMLALVGVHYHNFFQEARSFFPSHLLSAIFCACTLIIYPLFIYDDEKLKKIGLAISVIILLGTTIYSFVEGRRTYNTTLLLSGGSHNIDFDDTYNAYYENPAFGDVYFKYNEAVECYEMDTHITKLGTTNLIVESPSGEKRIFRVDIKRDTFDIEEVNE